MTQPDLTHVKAATEAWSELREERDERRCPSCSGGGLIDEHTECSRCEGSGRLPR